MDEFFRTCPKCKEIKFIHEFSPNKYYRSGRQSYCKPCVYESRNIARRKDYANKRNDKLRLKALEIYGTRCNCCGETEPDFLTFDHVNSDGHIDRIKISNQALYAKLIREKRDDIQILCWNCNCARYYRGGICPHKK